MKLSKLINKGLIDVYIPITLIVTSITISSNYFTTLINSNYTNAITAISLIISIFIGWIWWSYKIVKWKYWAFSQVTFEESIELYNKAIKNSLIWPTGNIFNKTEIWTKNDLEKWKKINSEIQKLFKSDKNLN